MCICYNNVIFVTGNVELLLKYIYTGTCYIYPILFTIPISSVADIITSKSMYIFFLFFSNFVNFYQVNYFVADMHICNTGGIVQVRCNSQLYQSLAYARIHGEIYM